VESWDGIVVGAGHNGLTCAAYLARAGLRVLVLEANPWIGGGTVTEELTLPGFRHNTHANYFIGFDVAPVYRDLELDRWGFRFVVPDVQCAWLCRDGRALVFHRELEPTVASIARFSHRDAETYRSLYERFGTAMRPLLVSMLYHPPLTPVELRERLRGPWADDLLSHAPLTLYQAVDRHFASEPVRVFFKTLLHVITADDVPGTGLLFISLLASFTRQALPLGGAASFPRALANLVEARGGRILTGARVEHLGLRSGAAREVELADGRRFEATGFVASAVDFPQTVAMAEGAFAADIDQKARDWSGTPTASPRSTWRSPSRRGTAPPPSTPMSSGLKSVWASTACRRRFGAYPDHVSSRRPATSSRRLSQASGSPSRPYGANGHQNARCLPAGA